MVKEIVHGRFDVLHPRLGLGNDLPAEEDLLARLMLLIEHFHGLQERIPVALLLEKS